jgi:hypothetical protein
LQRKQNKSFRNSVSGSTATVKTEKDWGGLYSTGNRLFRKIYRFAKKTKKSGVTIEKGRHIVEENRDPITFFHTEAAAVGRVADLQKTRPF